MAVAVLSALQTFFSFASRADAHRSAGARYAMAKRRLDVLLLKTEDPASSSTSDLLAELQALVGVLDDIEQGAPDVPDSVYDRARAEQAERDGGI
nr:SLATT domain-containing protein [Auraticoccus monumenti]